MFKSFFAILAIGGTYGAILTRDSTFNCGSNTVLTANNGTIISHVGLVNNHHYGKNMHCTWTIRAPEGMHVYVAASQFDLELDMRCAYDSLTLYGGNTTMSPELGKYCGRAFKSQTSPGRYLTLEFQTDGNNQQFGFQLDYTFVDTPPIPTCNAGQFACDNGNCIEKTYVCDTDDDCGDDSDEQHCVNTGGNLYPVNITRPSFCGDDQFTCRDSYLCIPHSWVCDGDRDCADMSDEHNCTISSFIN